MRLKIFTVALAVAASLAACGGDGEKADPQTPPTGSADSFSTPFTDTEAYPIFVSSEITVGEYRFLIGLLDENERVGKLCGGFSGKHHGVGTVE